MTLRKSIKLKYLHSGLSALATVIASGAAVAADNSTERRMTSTNAPKQTVKAVKFRAPVTTLKANSDVPIAIQTLPKAQGTALYNVQQPIYDLPFKGDDLNPGERYFRGKKIHSESGPQKWGYDLGAVRLVNGKWSHTKNGYNANNPKNTDYVVYGKPVYAMGDGKIIQCWRNAPDNPRPYSSALGDSFDMSFEDRPWLHSAWRSKRMSGAGNFVLVEESDGDKVLYAHFKPGSLSTNLCPHNQTLFSAPNKTSEANVPLAQQKTIKKGQKLGLVGNAGNSSAPHYHEHIQDKYGQPVPLKFKRGLSTPMASNGTADINSWSSFRNKKIPSGRVLIWPPLSKGANYARHKMSASTFQRMFDWLAESGYQLSWIDGYSVGGKPYLNHVWKPATGAWRSYFLLSPSAYQAKFTKAIEDGYKPTQVESSLVNGQVRYSVIFAKNKPGKILARHGLNYDQHMTVMNEAKSKGLSPTNISVVSVGGQRKYTVLYRADNIGQWQVKSRVPAAEYQALYNQNNQAGRRPNYVNAYMHNGKANYTVVFSSKPSAAQKDRHGLTPAQYQSEFNSAGQAGYLIDNISGYDGAQSNHRYIASWRK